MAFPTVEATAEYTEGTSTTTHPIDLPTGITAGDLLLVFASTTGNADSSFRVPLGWNIYYWGTDSSGSDNRVVGLVRVADGTEGSTVTVEVRTSLRMVAHSYRISGFNSDDPLYPDNVGPDDYDMSLVERAFGPALGVSRRKLNASSEDPSAFTLANSTDWGTSTIAVHPASAGTFPEAVAQTGNSTFSSTTSHVTDLPSGINSGDLLLAFFNRRINTDDITWPAGWTVITSFASGDNRLEIAYREADGTEGTDITITTGSSAYSSRAVYRITDAEDPSTQAPEVATASGTSSSADPPSLTPTGGAQDYLWFATFQQDNDSAFPHQSESTAVGSSGNPDPPSITPDAGADDYLWLALCHIIDTDDPPSAPTNYTNLLLNAVFNNGFATAQRELNAASEDPGTFDAGGANQTDTWVAGTLAIQPDSASPQTVSPSPVTATLSTVAPTVGATKTVSVGPTSITSQVVGPAVVTGEVVEQVAPVGATFGVVGPSVVPGEVTVAPSPVASVWSASSQIGIAAGVDPLVATFSPVDPSVVPGEAVVSVSPVSMSISAVVSDVLVDQTLQPSSVSIQATAVDPQVVAGAVTLTPVPVVQTASTPPPVVNLGVVGVASPVVFTTSVVDPALQIGEAVVEPSSVGATFQIQTPAVTVGLLAQPSPVSSTWSAVDPSVQAGEAIVSVSPAVATFVAVNLASKEVEASPVGAAFLATTPTTLLTMEAQAISVDFVATVHVAGDTEVFVDSGPAVSTYTIPTATLASTPVVHPLEIDFRVRNPDLKVVREIVGGTAVELEDESQTVHIKGDGLRADTKSYIADLRLIDAGLRAILID